MKNFIIGFCLAHSSFSCQAEEPLVNSQSKVGVPLFSVSEMRDMEIIDAVYQSENEDLIEALGRASKGKANFPQPLVWHRPIDLEGKRHTICIFDSRGYVLPGDNPRTLVLFDAERKISAWVATIGQPAFGAAFIAQSLDHSMTDVITVNPSPRFDGELFFERYRITPTKIEKLGTGPNPRDLK